MLRETLFFARRDIRLKSFYIAYRTPIVHIISAIRFDMAFIFDG